MGQIRAHAGAGHHHRDRANRADFRTQAVADAFITVDDYCLATEHGEHIAFGANGRAGGAADAILRVNMGVLGLRAIGAQRTLLRGFLGAGVLGVLLLEIPAHKKHRNDRSDQEANEIIHHALFSHDGCRTKISGLISV